MSNLKDKIAGINKVAGSTRISPEMIKAATDASGYAADAYHSITELIKLFEGNLDELSDNDSEDFGNLLSEFKTYQKVTDKMNEYLTRFANNPGFDK